VPDLCIQLLNKTRNYFCVFSTLASVVNNSGITQQEKMNIQLGASYKDVITNFSGVAVGHCVYISGCSQVLLVPKVDAKGKRMEGEWFDEQRLEQIEAEIIVLQNELSPGADKEAPKR